MSKTIETLEKLEDELGKLHISKTQIRFLTELVVTARQQHEIEILKSEICAFVEVLESIKK